MTTNHKELTKRAKKEIKFAKHYANDPHGTDGHHRLMLIADMPKRLEAINKLLFDGIHIMDEKGRRVGEKGGSYALFDDYWDRVRLDMFEAKELTFRFYD